MTPADISEALFARFGGRLSLTAIARVVRQCRRELEITRGSVTAEELERIAWERVGHLAEHAPGQTRHGH